MNNLQSIIDRQLGIFCRFNYDNVLKRLVVDNNESFYALQSNQLPGFEQDPPIFACRFSEVEGYEHILALANEDGRIAIQNTNSRDTRSDLQGYQCHNNAVFDLAWMPKNNNFVTVSGDHTACLWDLADGMKRVLVFSSHTRSVKTAVFAPTNPSVFATGARDGHILLWDIRANNQPTVVSKPDNCLMNCHSSFAPKTPGSTGKRPRLDNHRAISITGLVFQDDLTLISCGECDGNIKAWDLRKNYNIYKREPLPKHSIPYCGSSAKNGYTNLIIDDASIRLYASCMDNVIYCFNISTYSAVPEQRYIGHENSTFYIKTSLSPDNMYLVSGSSDKNAYIWNVKYSEPVVKLAGHWAEVTCAAWCQKGDTKIVTCSDDARHNIWRVGNEDLDAKEAKGRAEAVPRTDLASLPKWGAADRTPSSLKRKQPSTPGSYGAKRLRLHDNPARRTKRCLTDLLNASRHSDADEAEVLVKRLKLDVVSNALAEGVELLPAGTKRPLERAQTTQSTQVTQVTPPDKRARSGAEAGGSGEWGYIPPRDASSFLTPTKKYERRECRVLSPRSPCAPSPAKRKLSLSPPTKDLPDFVASGEAPHLRLMSPLKKRPLRRHADWLTQLARSVRAPPIAPAPAPASPHGPNTPAPSATATLLKYFNRTAKKK